VIYLTASILGSHPEAHRTRAYVHALARLGEPIWAIWKDATPVQPEIVDPNFRGILRLASAADGHSPEPCHAIIRAGAVMDVITQRAANKAPYEVAFIDWWTGTLPPRLARRLAEFDEVWTKTPAERTTVEAAFDAIKSTTPVRYFPLPTTDLGLARVKPLEEPGEPVAVAVGEWGGWDNVRAAFHAFALSSVEGRLLLVCPNVPFITREELEEYCAREGLLVPRVSTVREFPKRWDELCGLMAMGTSFLDTSRRIGGSWLYAVADGLGVRVDRRVSRAPVEAGYAPYVPPQEWKETDTEHLAHLLSTCGLLSERIEPLETELSPSIAATVRSWDTSLAPEAPKVVAANPDAVVPPTLLVVVPFRNRPVNQLEATLRSVATQLGPMDELLVSDQGSDDETFIRLESLCAQYGASLVTEDTFEDVQWNIARARNVGVRHATETTDWVMCVDADIVLSPGCIQALKMAIVRDPGQGYAPYVDEVSEVVGGWARREAKEILGSRIGSGIAALPRAKIEELRGWDEEYEGYGSEDIDLFHRLRNMGFEVVPWECPTGRPQHQAHPPSGVKMTSGKENLARVDLRRRGELGWTANETGWGDGGVLCLARGEDVG